MSIVAEFIDRVIKNRTDAQMLKRVSLEVKDLCSSFPLYSDLMAQ